jgi:hypothetical protein
MAVIAIGAIMVGGDIARAFDAETITNLLADAKAEAMTLNRDAQEMKALTNSTVEWQAHADRLNRIRDHVNRAGGIVQQMNDMRRTASQWQRIAIDRITPALNELAVNTQRTIEYLTANQSRVRMPLFKDYTAANAELAETLSETITDFVGYANAKAKLENLTRKLELPPGQ